MKLYKQTNPLVSVILPTYNRYSYLRRSIDSVIRQTFKDWELLVIDDGSSDKTFSLIIEYQEKFPKIRYMRHSNKKLPLTLNTGILAACGKYIAFIGSDDEWKPDHLERNIEIFYLHKDTDLVYGTAEIIGDKHVPDKNDRTKRINLDDCIIGGTFVVKKDLFISAGGFNNIDYSEDSDFFERIKDIANIIKTDFKTYIYYRNTAGSITNSN
ncbi:MAG: glycosyltransferase family 2 protein [Ignavibacteria bacterium]|nr:glycosyltransferase family 2 protein [Ignavibacteria bacterium]